MSDVTLIIAPHLDDEAISCGGLIQKRIAAGCTVYVSAIYGRKYNYGAETEDMSLPEEWNDALRAEKVLKHQLLVPLNSPEGEPHTVGYYKILSHLENLLRKLKPQELIIPGEHDLNQDHRVLNHICRIATRPVNLGNLSRILEFIALDGHLKMPNYFVGLTTPQMSIKLDALAEYRRESRQGISPRSPELIIAQAKVWGAACGQEFSEGYRLVLERH